MKTTIPNNQKKVAKLNQEEMSNIYGGAKSDVAAAGMHENPLYTSPTGGNNPLY